MFFEPIRGWRRTAARDSRTRGDWAEEVRTLLDQDYPHAKRVKRVCDYLNTHGIASLHEAFPAKEAHRLARRLELHRTPRHGSWLNVTEIELSVLSRQCLDRRIGSAEALSTELKAWTTARNANANASKVHRRFTTQDARNTLRHLYPHVRNGAPNEGDLRVLDEFRDAFAAACEIVVKRIHECDCCASGRSRETTESIRNKLIREGQMRLSRMQDIAGRRIVVPDISSQNPATATLKRAFAGSGVTDRRENSSHGYRAVHMIAKKSGVQVEIQFRTTLQHRWARLSEKASAVVDFEIKYGGDPRILRSYLDNRSRVIARVENAEIDRLSFAVAHEHEPEVARSRFVEVQESKRKTTDVTSQLLAMFEDPEKSNQ